MQTGWRAKCWRVGWAQQSRTQSSILLTSSRCACSCSSPGTPLAERAASCITNRWCTVSNAFHVKRACSGCGGQARIPHCIHRSPSQTIQLRCHSILAGLEATWLRAFSSTGLRIGLYNTVKNNIQALISPSHDTSQPISLPVKVLSGGLTGQSASEQERHTEIREKRQEGRGRKTERWRYIDREIER